MQAGDRYGRWTVIGHAGKKHYWDVMCDCGVERSVYLYSLRSGKSSSCGCYLLEILHAREGVPIHTEETKALLSERQKTRWKEGSYESEAVRTHVRQLGEGKAGLPQVGRSAKGPLNARSKCFRLRSPNGDFIEGLNLYHLVRENKEMFDPVDTRFRVNRHGTQTTCTAIVGLHKLFQHGQNRRNSWKGWTAPPQP